MKVFGAAAAGALEPDAADAYEQRQGSEVGDGSRALVSASAARFLADFWLG